MKKDCLRLKKDPCSFEWFIIFHQLSYLEENHPWAGIIPQDLVCYPYNVRIDLSLSNDSMTMVKIRESLAR